MQDVSLRQEQSLHRDPRDAGPGPDARRHQSLLPARQARVPLHGDVHLRELHRAARDRGGAHPQGRAVREGLLHRLRRDDGHRRRGQHREGRGRRPLRGVRARRHRAQRDPGPAAWSAPTRSWASTEPGEASARRALRHDALREPERGRGRPRAAARRAHRRRRRLLLRVHRQREGDAPGARVLPPRLGRVDRDRRRRRRRGDRDPAVPARDRPRLARQRIRRRQGSPRRAADRGLVHGRQDPDRPADHPRAAARAHQRGVRAHARRVARSAR